MLVRVSVLVEVGVFVRVLVGEGVGTQPLLGTIQGVEVEGALYECVGGG